MGRIRQLPQSLVNRIAAGECVERPASVVKELVENALDAGASQIDVSTEEGGRQLIRVVDDGCGMDADDLRLCIAPHATSKIAQDDDLFDIRTMGFRGEALPSIGSVARLRIVSRAAGAEVGYELRVEGGEIHPPKPVAAPPGTTVEVADLFYNVPARRKFLKTNQTESGQITEQLARIALAHHDVGFTLTSGARTTHRLATTADRRQRIRDFYGPELADGLMEIERDGGGVQVVGYVAPPALCRKSTKWEYVFVNGRFVRDRFVSHAVKEAYRSLIQNEFPVVFLFITIDPAAIDVNVHPTKIEVRWRDSNFVHNQVLAAIRDKFLSTNLDRPYHLRTAAEDADRERARAAMVEFFTGSNARRTTHEWQAPPTRHAALAQRARDAAETRWDAARDFGPAPAIARSRAERGADVLTPGDHEPAQAERGALAPPNFQEDPATQRVDAWVAPIAPRRALQVHNTYLVLEEDDGIVLIDQHALHERILYEELRARIAEKPLESQRLLLPDIVPAPADRLEALETHADTLARLGVELTAAGPQSVAVQAFPLLLERVDRVDFVRDLLDLLAEPGTRTRTESLVHGALDMMACKAAVKAGDPLSAAEIAELLARRAMAERSSHCPHGRPTTLHLSLRDLEKQFKRR